MVTKRWGPEASYPHKRAQLAATGGLGFTLRSTSGWSDHHYRISEDGQRSFTEPNASDKHQEIVTDRIPDPPGC